MARIEVEDLSVRLGEREVLRGLTLTIGPGVLALIGPNGCGKTTLLRSLIKGVPPSAGRVLLDGRPLASMRTGEVARSVAMVFQEHEASFPYLVEDMVLLGRIPRTRAWRAPGASDREAAAEAMARLGIERLRGKSCAGISGGERKLVYIAMALCQGSDAILFDEPTAFLDINNAVLVLDAIKSLARDDGKTIVVALHDVNHALLCADRALLMFGPGAFREGPVGELVAPAHLSELYGVGFEFARAEGGRRFIVPTGTGPGGRT